MDDLGARRQKFVEQHMDQLNKMQADLFKSMETVIVDKKTGGDWGLSFLNTLKTHLGFSRESTSRMKSEDRVKFAQMFYGYMETYMKAVMNDPGYKAVLKDIDTQMKSLQEEIRLIEEELKKNPSDKEKEEILDHKRDMLKRAA